MAQTGYCTLEDLRRALREAELPGDLSQDTQIAVDAITAQTEPLEKSLKRHWYEPTGIDEATEITIPTGPQSRDDEEDIPTGGAFVVDDDGPEPKTWHQDYTRIRLARRDATAITKLLVADGDGYTDWVASTDYSGGTWPDALGENYYLRINNGGWSDLYLDTTNLLVDGEDEEYVLDSFSNAVYVEFDYGHEGIPKAVRRAVAFRAASDFVEEASIEIPQNATLYNVESLAEEYERKADELLEEYQ
jgi:hypothetical protein